MKKTVMAAVVVGALAAPAMAFAQTQIYGYFNAEWAARATQPNTAAGAARHNAEAFNSSASYIGFRGEEKLGDGLSGWYQCETELGIFPRAAGQSLDGTGVVWCDRNSAAGVKGSYGNFYVGTWDSPLRRASNLTRITNLAGWLGSEGITLRAGEGSPDMSNRNTDTFNYDTPNFGGFSLSVQTTTLQRTVDAPASGVAKGRRSTLGGQFATGPVMLVAAYAVKTDNRASGGTTSSKDEGMLVGATYVLGDLKVGAQITNRKADDGAGTTGERKGANLAAEYRISGAHTIRGGIAKANKLTGSAAGAGTGGARQAQASYLYSFSKSTTASVSVINLKNDSNGTFNFTDLVAGPADVQTGESMNALVLGLHLRF